MTKRERKILYSLPRVEERLARRLIRKLLKLRGGRRRRRRLRAKILRRLKRIFKGLRLQCSLQTQEEGNPKKSQGKERQ